jgi:hypothetical protein
MSMLSFSDVATRLPARQASSTTTSQEKVLHCGALYKATLFAVILPLLFWRVDAHSETADSTLQVAEAALAKLDATNLDDDWHFSMELVEENELRIISSDPRRDKYERRQLLSVDGIPPDENRRKKFHQSEVKRIDGLDSDASGYRYLVDTQTLVLTEQGDGYSKLAFVPRIKAMEKSRDQVHGAILLNTQTQQIEEIEISNTGKLSPAFSVTVDSYRLVLKFQQEQGENLLRKLESRAVGKAGFMKSFDVFVAATVSDYKRADR